MQVFLIQSACRADCDTLAAGYTAGLAQAHLECGTDEGGETTLVGADDADSLYLFTGSGAAAAEDTLAVVADHVSRAVVDTGRSLFAIVVITVLHAQFLHKVCSSQFPLRTQDKQERLWLDKISWRVFFL